MDLEKEQVDYVFHDNQRPDITYDLKNTESSVTKIWIQGNTKNLSRLKELSEIKKYGLSLLTRRNSIKLLILLTLNLSIFMI